MEFSTCTNSTTEFSEFLCCPFGYQCILSNTACQSINDTTQIIPPSTCSLMSIFDDDDSGNQLDSSWTVVFIWPIAIILIFSLTTLLIFLIHRRRKNAETKNWNPSARTTADDRELPSYADHWRSSRPWWEIDSVNQVDIEHGDPPPDYPDCPKYPDAVFTGEWRQHGQEGNGPQQNERVSS